MQTKFDGLPDAGARTVYVRSVPVSELPEEVQEQLHEEMGDLSVLYAVHSPDGERLALVTDRSTAFALARQNDFAPVAVH